MSSNDQSRNDEVQVDNTTQTDGKKKSMLLATAAGVLLAGALAAAWFLQPQDKSWERQPYPATQDTVQTGESLDDFSRRHRVPTLTMAAFNETGMKQVFDTTCDRRRRSAAWPRYACNDGINIYQAHTTRPGQNLWVPVTYGAMMPNDVQAAAAEVGTAKEVVILVDATGGDYQHNLRYAAAIALKLQQREKLGTMWVFDANKMVEYADNGNTFEFGSRHRGIAGAIQALSLQPYDRILLVSGSGAQRWVDGKLPNGMTPVLGFCTSSTCERPMKEITDATGGRYVPFTG